MVMEVYMATIMVGYMVVIMADYMGVIMVDLVHFIVRTVIITEAIYLMKRRIPYLMAEEKDQVHFHQSGVVIQMPRALQEEILIFLQEVIQYLPEEFLQEVRQLQLTRGVRILTIPIHKWQAMQQTED
jgi:hypothetical protein